MRKCTINIYEEEIIDFIKSFFKENNKTPTIKDFTNKYKISSSYVYKFDSWTNLIKKCGLKPNKLTNLTDKLCLNWLKTHPLAKYNEIPVGIRKKLEKKYKTISNAKKSAGLLIIDWRKSKKRNINKDSKSGRPIEFTEEKIIQNLIELTIKLSRPPKTRDICKKNCEFTIGTVVGKFGSLNNALQKASLPIMYSHQIITNLTREFETIMVNIKFYNKDIPIEYNSNKLNPTFVYNDKCEIIKLKRSDIFLDINNIIKHKQNFKEVNVWFLIDDSLNEDENINIYCIMDFLHTIKNENIINKIKHLRQQYDDISNFSPPLVLKK